MGHSKTLRGKKILIVDDEPDILSTLKELLEECLVDEASDFAAARELLEANAYDVVILDIMGVNGYDLLEISTKKKIPTLMLTANALSRENFVKSIRRGANAYIPKEKISDIGLFLIDILEANEKGLSRLERWFARLEPFFEEKFGAYWKEKSDPEFWKKYY